MELLRGPGAQWLRQLTILQNHGLPVFSPYRISRVTSPPQRQPAVCLVHFKEEDARSDGDDGSDDPIRIEGVTEEFMVHLTRDVKDAQMEEKHCYHCSSPEHFICNCLLIKTSRENAQLNGKEGMASKKGAQTPLTTANTSKKPPARGFSRCKATPTDSTSWIQTHFSVGTGSKNIARVRINGESCMALLENGTQINTIMSKYVSDHSLQMGLITDLLDAKVACVGLGNAYMRPLGYIVIWVQVDRFQGYDEEQIALVNPDLSNFAAWIPVILGTPTISCMSSM